MRSMQWQLGILGTISAFAYRHKETKKNLCHPNINTTQLQTRTGSYNKLKKKRLSLYIQDT